VNETASLATIEKLPVAKAIEMTEQGHKKADMALCNMGSLFSNPAYEGTFVARRGESYAGISLWDGSALNGIKIERILLPVSYYRAFSKSTAATVAAAAVGAWGSYHWCFALYVAFTGASQEVRSARFFPFSLSVYWA
jgi:hypothetical protein